MHPSSGQHRPQEEKGNLGGARSSKDRYLGSIILADRRTYAVAVTILVTLERYRLATVNQMAWKEFSHVSLIVIACTVR
jgi:hypothetical protein